jgi:hypothetical protein
MKRKPKELMEGKPKAIRKKSIALGRLALGRESDGICPNDHIVGEYHRPVNCDIVCTEPFHMHYDSNSKDKDILNHNFQITDCTKRKMQIIVKNYWKCREHSCKL